MTGDKSFYWLTLFASCALICLAGSNFIFDFGRDLTFFERGVLIFGIVLAVPIAIGNLFWILFLPKFRYRITKHYFHDRWKYRSAFPWDSVEASALEFNGNAFVKVSIDRDARQLAKPFPSARQLSSITISRRDFDTDENWVEFLSYLGPAPQDATVAHA